jgi:hypothetical protein
MVSGRVSYRGQVGSQMVGHEQMLSLLACSIDTGGMTRMVQLFILLCASGLSRLQCHLMSLLAEQAVMALVSQQQTECVSLAQQGSTLTMGTGRAPCVPPASILHRQAPHFWKAALPVHKALTQAHGVRLPALRVLLHPRLVQCRSHNASTASQGSILPRAKCARHARAESSHPEETCKHARRAARASTPILERHPVPRVL